MDNLIHTKILFFIRNENTDRSNSQCCLKQLYQLISFHIGKKEYQHLWEDSLFEIFPIKYYLIGGTCYSGFSISYEMTESYLDRWKQMIERLNRKFDTKISMHYTFEIPDTGIFVNEDRSKDFFPEQYCVLIDYADRNCDEQDCSM